MILFNENIGQTHDEFLVDQRVSNHLTQVLKVKEGQNLKVGCRDVGVSSAKVTRIFKDQVSLKLNQLWSPQLLSPRPKLILGLPRPKSFRRMLRQSVVLGFKEIHFSHSFRVEKSYWQTPYLKSEKVEEEIILGLEQAEDVHWPKIYFHKRFKIFFEDQVSLWINKNSVAICAHPEGESFDTTETKSVNTLALGPEGGWIQYELDLMNEIGLQRTSFSKRTLTSEAALPFISGRLQIMD